MLLGDFRQSTPVVRGAPASVICSESPVNWTPATHFELQLLTSSFRNANEEYMQECEFIGLGGSPSSECCPLIYSKRVDSTYSLIQNVFPFLISCGGDE